MAKLNKAFLASLMVTGSLMSACGMSTIQGKDASLKTTMVAPAVSEPEKQVMTILVMQQNHVFTHKDGHILFDESLAKSITNDKEALALARELANYTDHLISDSPKRDGFIVLGEGNSTESDYPNVQAFFKAAANLKTPSTQEFGVKADIASEWDCGFWGNPKPAQAAEWKWHDAFIPQSTLVNWGYHSTPGLAGGGWTRPQTYHWWFCGWNTFRDQALIRDGKIKEQNYEGFVPRGEPNPEVYASGPWPYALWPAYVQWWHDTH